MKLSKTHTTFKLFISFFIILIISCQYNDDDIELNNVSNLRTLNFNHSKFVIEKNNKAYNELEDQLFFSSENNALLEFNETFYRSDDGAVYDINISTALIDENNLNHLFSESLGTSQILCISLAKDNIQNINGIIVHYIQDNSKLKIAAYNEITNNLYEVVEFPANEVKSFTLDNLLFVSKNLFPNHDIETLAISEIDNLSYNSKYNDIALLSFLARYSLSLESDNSFTEGGSRPCSVAVHTCLNGSETNVECAPAGGGCRPAITDSCPRNSSSIAFLYNQMQVEYDQFSNNLPENNLYEIRNWLNTTDKGKMYVEAYYLISSHFKETLDTELLLALAESSFSLASFLNAINNDDESFFLTEELFEELSNIASLSAEKSESVIYKSFIFKFLEEVSQFSGKNVLQIKTLMTNP